MVFRQEFGSSRAVEPCIFGLIHNVQTATTKLFCDMIVHNDLPDHFALVVAQVAQLKD